MRVPACVLLLAVCATGASAQSSDDAMRFELGRLRGELALLQGRLQERDARLEAVASALKGLEGEISALRADARAPLAGPFLAAPPAGSDVAGVARVAVLAPRVAVDSSRRHDSVLLKLRRIETDAVRPVAELELLPDQTSVELPIDRSGALYVVDWSTSEGYSYPLVLKDGASGQPAALCQVRPQQAQGRFVLVAYRLE
jgi:hypothetical protein